MIILQPEGSLDGETSLEGALTFFSPVILVEILRKPNAVMNGTIPIYDDERGSFLTQLFAMLPSVAARDATLAEY
jgi:hypothetical protein